MTLTERLSLHRYQPCDRCGESPAVHNPHPLNDAYVGHEYTVAEPRHAPEWIRRRQEKEAEARELFGTHRVADRVIVS